MKLIKKAARDIGLQAQPNAQGKSNEPEFVAVGYPRSQQLKVIDVLANHTEHREAVKELGADHLIAENSRVGRSIKILLVLHGIDATAQFITPNRGGHEQG